MNISNILPSIQYSAGAGSQLSIDIQPTRIISGRFRIRPKSQYEHKLLSAAVLKTHSGIVIQNDQQAFSIGGVQVLSKRYSHPSNSLDMSESSSTSDDIRFTPSHSKSVTPNSDQNLKEALKAYKSNHSSPRRFAREKGTKSLLSKDHPTNKHNKPTKSSNNHNITKGKNAIQSNAKHRENTSPRKSNNFSPNITQSKPRASVDNNRPDFSTSTTKAVKVFLSQKQSPNLNSSTNETNMHPSAPPGTPCFEMLKRFDYIPSLSDNLAKQQVKTKLKVMKKVETERERVKQAEKLRNDLKDSKEKEQELKRQQRRIIYQLNAAMTKVENDQFECFKKNHGLKPKEYPSPFVKLK